MTLLALIHAVWLLLLPGGTGFVLVGTIRRHRIGIIVGGLAILLSLPAVAFCAMMWPPDFLLSRAPVRVPVTVGQYTVTLEQVAGPDFYATGFEVRRGDGQVAQVFVDGDADKWWRLRVVARGSRSYFVHGRGGVTPQTPYVDAADETVFAGPYGDTHKLDALQYAN